MRPITYSSRRAGPYKLAAIDLEQLHQGFQRQIVAHVSDQPVGSILIENTNRLLYLLLTYGYALRYGLSVERDGFAWTGTATVYRRAHLPTWTPPQ